MTEFHRQVFGPEVASYNGGFQCDKPKTSSGQCPICGQVRVGRRCRNEGLGGAGRLAEPKSCPSFAKTKTESEFCQIQGSVLVLARMRSSHQAVRVLQRLRQNPTDDACCAESYSLGPQAKFLLHPNGEAGLCKVGDTKISLPDVMGRQRSSGFSCEA